MCIWHGQKLWLLEQTIRRKWKKVKDWPLVNIIFKKFKEKDIFFNPEVYLEGEQEKYFELLQEWKTENEKSYLDQHPYLRFLPIRHEKFIWNPRKKIIC